MNQNNNKVLKSKKPFFTTNKKVVMLLGFVVVVGAVLGALYGTGVISSVSGDCSDLSECQNKLKTELNTKHPNVKLSDCEIKYYTCETLKDFIQTNDNAVASIERSRLSTSSSKLLIEIMEFFKDKNTPEDLKYKLKLIKKLKPDMSENEIKQTRQEFEAIKNNAK